MRSILQVLQILVILARNAGAADEAIAHDETSSDDTGNTWNKPSSEEGVVVASVEMDLPSVDLNETCHEWAMQGECQENPEYMLKSCAASCSVSTKAKAYFIDGEDFAIGAVRFSEEYDAQHIPLVLEAAKKLDDTASIKAYTPPQELTHCALYGKTNSKPCSAGKLWKRAEELRIADIHDEAAADLIRALMKSGIEIDFVEKAQKSLQWTLGSIQRLRERERKQAEEEAKLEERRKEEQLAMEEAATRRKEYEADFGKFSNNIEASITMYSQQEVNMNSDGTLIIDDELKPVILELKRTFVKSGSDVNGCEKTLGLLKKISLGEKTIELLLIEARCYEVLGQYRSAMTSAGKLINKGATYQSLPNDSPIILAMQLGANAAMQLGLSESALSFYQTVLKLDPEQDRARTQYRGLKKVMKLLDKAENEIQKGYNKAASTLIGDCLSAMRGLDVDSPLFRSKIQLKQCTIQSAMGKHEEALANCDAAVKLRISNDDVSPASRKEAYLVRAEALMLDNDYDEAVQDFRAAFDLVPDDDVTGEKRELQQKLQSTMRQQEMWNGGKIDFRFNEKTGYPNGMPPQRDHAKILQLPIDLEERSKEIKCAWLKKQFKMLVKKYHPDKYKGNKKRAARKFKEIKEAKEIISSSWQC